MKRALIRPDRCSRCQPCAVQTQCPMSAVFRESPAEQPWIDFYRCSGCMKCKDFCPQAAIDEIAHPCSGRPNMGW
jgi:Pyruvate/2-oxoacid:ferredoxin oxidoreductase delta subunit